MNILLLAMPRTGSKFVQENLHRYLTNLAVLKQAPTAQQFYDPMIGEKITIQNGVIAFSPDSSLQTIKQLVLDRIPIIKQLDFLSVKLHQNGEFEDEEMAYIQSFDHVIYLKRRDLFGQILSSWISKHLGNWSPGNKQDSLKQTLIENPVPIDLDLWKVLCDEAIYDHLRELPGSHTVYSEDLYHLFDPLEFAQVMNLQPIHFVMAAQRKEYGESKELMISNLVDIKELFEERLSYWKNK